MRRLLGATGFQSALRHRDLRLLLGALLISATGSWAFNVALLTYVYDHTHSLGWVGAAGVGRFLPSLVASPYAGVVAERVERVRLLIASDLCCAASQAGLAVVALAQGPAALAIALAAVTSVAGAVYPPATAALLPQLAGEEDLAAANALNGAIENVVVVAGPAIGAGLVAVSSASSTFALDAATFVVSVLLVRRISARSRPSDVTEEGVAGPLAQMAVGFRAVVSSPLVAVLVGFSVLASFLYGADTVAFVGVGQDKLGLGPNGFGVLLAGCGVGGLLATPLVDRLAALPRLGLVMVAGMAAYCLPTALLVVVHSPALAFVIEMVRGAGTIVVDVIAFTALQRAVEPELVARVFGVFFSLVIAAIALGTVATPPVVDGVGLDTTLYLLAFVVPAVCLLALPALGRRDRRAAARLGELAPRVAALEGLAIFAAASRAVLERLAGACEERTAAPGEVLVREGDHADALFVLRDGAVDVTARGDAGGPERFIRTMGPGTYFGELGLLERIPRTASVTARTPCSLYRLDGDAFVEALAAATPAGSILETARARLAVTHPGRNLSYRPATVTAGD